MESSTNNQSSTRNYSVPIKQEQYIDYSRNDEELSKSTRTVSVGQMIRFALKKQTPADSNESNTQFNGFSSDNQSMFDLRAPYQDEDNGQNYDGEQFGQQGEQNENEYEDNQSNQDFDPNNISDVEERLRKYSKKDYPIRQTNSYGGQKKFVPKDLSSESFKVKNNFVQKNYPQDVIYSGRNTLGKEYTDQYRRAFSKKFLQKIQGLDKNMINTMLARQADRIKVYPNQVAVWVGIYRIAFRIQSENSRRQMTEDQAVLLVEECLVQYLNNNPFQKKYRFIRVANGSFRALGIRKCTGDYWLKSFIKRFQPKFDQRIDFNLLIMGNKRDKDYQSTRIDDEIFGRSGAPAQFKQFRPPKKFDSYEASKPLDFKKQVVQKIDQTIQIGIQKIFRDKQRDIGTNINILKGWYRSYGKYNFFRQQERYEPQVVGQRMPVINPISSVVQNGKSQAMNKIQKMVLDFIRDQPNCKRSKIQFEANQILSAIRVPELQNPRIARAWLTNFLQRNCIQNGDSYQLKDSSQKPMQPKLSGNSIQFQALQQKNSTT